MRRLALALALVLPVASGCFVSRQYVNQPLAEESVVGLVPGQSSELDVARALGGPTDVVQLGRRSAWRYDHTRQKRAGVSLLIVTFAGTDVQSDRIWVFFDEQGILTHYGATFDADRARYSVPPFGVGHD